MSGSQEYKKSRTLVLCFDGTMNEYDADNTNVVKLISLLKRNDPTRQLCYYQAGIGTYFQPGLISPLWTWLAKVADEAVAWYLDAHVMGGYKFLMQNYCDGDKICLFGFSRGAYTARALGGMLFKVGLLPRDNPEQVPFAYKLYKRTDPEGVRLSAGFKQTFAQDVNVEFMGVWDTVSSIGLIKERTLPFTYSNSSIKTFRHALSLDERRAKYRPNLFHRPSPNPSHDPEDASPDISRGPGSPVATRIASLPQSPYFFRPLKWKHKSWRGEWREGAFSNGDRFKATPVDVDVPAKYDTETDVLEVWFAGCHSDVGGGNVIDANKHSLAQITLRWMVRQIVVSECGILFDDIALARNDIDITSASVTPDKASPEEREDDKIDAVQPLFDRLKTDLIWWVLEIIPTPYSYQDGQGVWHHKWGFHLGKGREIPDCNPKFHISVKDRIRDKTLGYTPKAKWETDTEEYVE